MSTAKRHRAAAAAAAASSKQQQHTAGTDEQQTTRHGAAFDGKTIAWMVKKTKSCPKHTKTNKKAVIITSPPLSLAPRTHVAMLQSTVLLHDEDMMRVTCHRYHTQTQCITVHTANPPIVLV